MDNNAKSCVSILIAKPGHCWHNFRRGFLPNDCHPEYLHENEYTHTFAEARALGQKMRDDAVAAYVKKYNQKPQFDENKIFWEASINAREYHTLDDLRKVGKIIERRTGYRMVYGAIHRDEGHLNDEGQFVKNTHFQILFISLDENGNSMHRITRGKRQLMRDIQTEVARALNMERGIDKRISGREHLTPKQYKQAIKIAEPIKQELKLVKKDLTDAKKTIKELENALKEANKQARADLQEQGASRPDYAALEAENKRLKNELDELKKAPDISNIEDFKKSFEDKIRELMKHSKIKEIAEQTLNNEAILKPVTFGGYSKESVSAYVLGSVARYNAANKTLEKAQTFIHEIATKKEISVKAQLMAVRENKTLGGFLGATASKTDVDVSVLKREKAGLTDTIDKLRKQNELLQKTLKDTVGLVKQKDAQIAELQKNQEGFGVTANDHFYLGQATLLSELINSKKLCIEPKGHSLLLGLDSIISGEYPPANFEGIKSGLLSYVPRISQPENGLSL